ncbi:serine hydrolase domain-containing protein [Pseudonocardia oroxyli]|uniref:CubicO group peptidase, beta-lactamase class C family n=1 Tax=Pseudonocardia oroxyli TaxID=366584 RepID=A0A1G7TSU3_PSEOR|nr:serine hydrolase domain-containing protein [Pseudonocardia oroxyli]SDG38386.1 CubicO group peptidase, beta-lactamase class C family [Pseudonocardia oroxyli]
MQDARIEKALAEATTRYGERGLQVAAYLGPDVIVDAWTGPADQDGRPVTGDTLFSVFSVSKAITSLALHLQAERGLVDYESPVARYWPEFGGNGKGDILVRHVLSHQSGIPQMPEGVTPELLGDWGWMTARVAEFTPLFAPGTSSAYQSLVFGHIVGEVVRRTDPSGRDFGEFVRQELCAPLGIEDLFFGVPDQRLPDVAVLTSILSRERVVGETEASRLAKPDAVAPDAHVHNLDVVKQACYPAAGGIMSARAAARLAALVANGGELDGVRLLSEFRVRNLLTPRPNGDALDEVLFGGGRVAPSIGTGGFWLGGGTVLGGGAATLYHGGSGGSLLWVDLDRRLSVAIFHNRMFEAFDPGSGDHPFSAIGRAVLDVAGERLAAAGHSPSVTA